MIFIRFFLWGNLSNISDQFTLTLEQFSNPWFVAGLLFLIVLLVKSIAIAKGFKTAAILQASGEAETIRLKAVAQAEATKVTAIAGAEATSKVGNAEAEVILAKGKSTAEAYKLEVDAMGRDAFSQIRWSIKLPQIR